MRFTLSSRKRLKILPCFRETSSHRPMKTKPSILGKRLMVLGAGPFQVPAIIRAVELGCQVVTVDHSPNNVGHEFSHESINCSTVDRHGVHSHAEQLGIDGIMTMASDVALPTVSFVGAKLHLPAPGASTVETLTDKTLFRKFQVLHGLEHPVFDYGSKSQEIDWSRFKGLSSLVVKPADTSGSRGISQVEATDESSLLQAFCLAQRFGRSGKVCVEEYVSGHDVTAEGYRFSDGRTLVAFTQKFTRRCVVVGHHLPGMLTPSQERFATEAVLEACDAAGYSEGPFDADLRITDGRAVILEMSPRLGGNGCPLLLGKHTGVDPIKLTIMTALGEYTCHSEPTHEPLGYGSTIIGSQTAGRLTSVTPIEQLQVELPYVVEGIWAARPGDYVGAFDHGGNALGCIVFESELSNYAERARCIREAASLDILPSDGSPT